MSTLPELQECLRDLEAQAARVRQQIAILGGDKRDLLKLDWRSELSLSVRAYNVLAGKYMRTAPGIETLGDLVRWTPQRILRLKNCGKVTLKEIQDELRSVGLELAYREMDEHPTEGDSAPAQQEPSEAWCLWSAV